MSLNDYFFFQKPCLLFSSAILQSSRSASIQRVSPVCLCLGNHFWPVDEEKQLQVLLQENKSARVIAKVWIKLVIVLV
jgi:hypothetical protein